MIWIVNESERAYKLYLLLSICLLAYLLFQLLFQQSYSLGDFNLRSLIIFLLDQNSKKDLKRCVIGINDNAYMLDNRSSTILSGILTVGSLAGVSRLENMFFYSFIHVLIALPALLSNVSLLSPVYRFSHWLPWVAYSEARNSKKPFVRKKFATAL